MRVLTVFLLVLLMGCTTATRHFRGAEAIRVTVDASSFDIRVRGNLAEAVRINPQYAPRLGPLRVQAGFAMAKVSGCRVSGVLGDQAVMTGVLDCTEAKPPKRSAEYDCKDVVQWLNTTRGDGWGKYTCAPKRRY